MTKNKPNIILFDLETLPDMEAVMDVFPGMSAYPGLTFKASLSSIICFGYKKLGDKKAKCISAWDFKTWDKDISNDKELCIAAREILSKADGIVTHNGKQFDLKVLNTRLLYHGLAPLHKIPHIDTKVAAKKISIFNNRLNTIAKFLGCEQKLENGGWDLWVKVRQRDSKSQQLMSKYCKQDVQVLEQIFNKLRPLADNIPNYNMFKGENIKTEVCPNCGGNHLQKHGLLTTKTGKRQRYLCTDCGSSSTESARKKLSK